MNVRGIFNIKITIIGFVFTITLFHKDIKIIEIIIKKKQKCEEGLELEVSELLGDRENQS